MPSQIFTYLLCYDVETMTPAGRRRLAKMHKLCKRYGQYVQDSVYECYVTSQSLFDLISSVNRITDRTSDSVRLYRLIGPRGDYLTVFGRDFGYDPEGPLIFG